MSATHTIIDTAIGELTLVARDGVLAGLYYPGHWTRPDRAAFGERLAAGAGGFAEVRRQLDAYLAGERTAFALATVPAPDGFHGRVWDRLAAIPYGETTTYGALARELGGGPSLARAVGRAVGANPLSIVVPCHRVVGGDGRLTGYAGGLERKRFLLELEGACARPLEPASAGRRLV
jgi:methylated-DNA-[protein]-cysteine S-methyltransferase